VILLGAVVALMIEGTVSYHRSYTTAPWREATAFLDEQARSGDVILFDKDFSRTNSFAYYWHRDDVFPQDHEDELPPAADRVWVVISLVPEDPGAVPAMLESAGYAQELDRFWEGTPGGIELLLFERPT
jgi:hypothetical protein